MRVLGIFSAAIILFAAAGFAQQNYTMELTGVADQASANGVYVSPYQGNIWTGQYTGGNAPTTTPAYSGYVICDDYTDESLLNDPWNAVATNAASLDGTELFTGGYTDPTADSPLWAANQHFTAQQSYNAVAWLANQLLLSGNVTNPTNQTNISFAIWNIMDNNQAGDPDGGDTTYITQAFAAVLHDGYVGSNVTVFTPAPKADPGKKNVSQEFLVVNGPFQTPEPNGVAVLGIDLLSALALLCLVVYNRSRVRT